MSDHFYLIGKERNTVEKGLATRVVLNLTKIYVIKVTACTQTITTHLPNYISNYIQLDLTLVAQYARIEGDLLPLLNPQLWLKVIFRIQI